MTVPPKFVIMSFESSPDTPHLRNVARIIAENAALERWLAEERQALLTLLSALVREEYSGFVTESPRGAVITAPMNTGRGSQMVARGTSGGHGAPAPAWGGLTPRLGFVVDIVGFGRRDAEQKEDLQYRLDALVGGLVADLGIDRAETESSVAGDSAVLFLPVGMASSYVLPLLISAATQRLERDTRRYRDRMRLRMAIGSGLLGTGPLGFTGQLVIDLHRLVDSAVLRQAIDDHEEAAFALLISHTVHDEVVRPGYLDGNDFTPVEIVAKEFAATAWLRLC
jgi:hypothetical protein